MRSRWYAMALLAGCTVSGAGTSDSTETDKVFPPNVDASSLRSATGRWTYNGKVISAWPRLISALPKGDDFAELGSVYQVSNDADTGYRTRRIEVYQTTGDCGTSMYFITDIEQDKHPREGVTIDGRLATHMGPRVYYVERYSSYTCARDYVGTWVSSAEPEEVSPQALKEFIRDTFLRDGQVNPTFVPTCIDMPSHITRDAQCITAESLGNLGT